jgi:hypothetical protein
VQRAIGCRVLRLLAAQPGLVYRLAAGPRHSQLKTRLPLTIVRFTD